MVRVSLVINKAMSGRWNWEISAKYTLFRLRCLLVMSKLIFKKIIKKMGSVASVGYKKRNRLFSKLNSDKNNA
jgi:hypothetical protein